MAVRGSWHDDLEGVILVEHVGEWTVQELTDAWATCGFLLDEYPQRAALVMDFVQSGEIPLGVTRVFGPAKDLLERPELYIILVVGSNLMVRTSAKVFMQMYPRIARKIEFVPTLEDAYARIAELSN